MLKIAIFISIGLISSISGQDKAIKELIELSKTKPEAYFQLGEIYYRGEQVPKDKSKAFEWFEKGANAGNAPCMYELAVMYQEGTVKPMDLKKALGLFEKSAKLGLKTAQYNTGIYYLFMASVVDQNIQLGIEYIHKAADQGEINALTRLGVFYERGEFVKRDIDKAIEFYQKAVQKDSHVAQFFLGKMYIIGNTKLGKDNNKGIALLEKAGNAGSVEAMIYLGGKYNESIYLPKDLKKALFWYKKLADMGHPYGIKKQKEIEEKLKKENQEK